MSMRAVPVIVFVAGLTIGSLADRIPSRQPVRADGYWMLVGDFHVHAFPGDGALAPWALRDEAARSGLDVFAVTNHNQVVAARLAAWVFGSAANPIVIPGEEITTPGYHLIAVGIEDPVSPHQPASGAIAAVHAQHGIAIAAHPGGRHVAYDTAALAHLDGAEAAHYTDTETMRRAFVDFYERGRRVNPHLSPIGSSDFHASPGVALCRTYVFARAADVGGVLEAIRNGRTVAEDWRGRLYGDASLVAAVRRARPARGSDPNPGWRRASMALAWLGVLGVVVLGPDTSRRAIPVSDRRDTE